MGSRSRRITFLGDAGVPPLPQAPSMTFFITGAGPGKGADWENGWNC